jgi:hypothetical protein
MTASFDMTPVPKRTEKQGLLGAMKTVFVDAPVYVFHMVTGNTPIRDVRMMEDPDFPDERRKGIYNLVSLDWGQGPTYTRRYRQIAQSDPDYTVRAAAIRALNASRDREAVPVFVAALNDASAMVRWEAAKALSNVPDRSAMDPLMRTLGNQTETKAVRIAAAEALRHYKDMGVARVLAASLTGRDFGIAWQSRWSLRILTGRDYRYDERAWLAYLTGPDQPFG